jgi:hypothetical protein
MSSVECDNELKVEQLLLAIRILSPSEELFVDIARSRGISSADIDLYLISIGERQPAPN